MMRWMWMTRPYLLWVDFTPSQITADGYQRRRVTKRKVIYAESDSDASSGEDVRASSSKAPMNSKARRGRKSLKADSDSDDFVLDAADEEAMGE